jgi:hypothetical protein
MRDDQRKQLEELAERLADVFLVEADPDNWSGAGKLPCDMDPQTRGNRHWDRKGAMGTGGVLRYALDLVKFHQVPNGQGEAEQDADLDKKIKDAEKRAAAAVNRALDKARKRTFDSKTHGK